MKLLAIAVLVASSALGTSARAQARGCEADSVKTKLGALAAKPGTMLTTRYDALPSITNGTMSVRVDVVTMRDEDRAVDLKGLAFVVRGGAQSRRALVDGEEVPRLAQALAAFEKRRLDGMPNETRQQYSTLDRIQLETFWDGKQRALSITSGGACPVSVYFDADALGQLSTIVATGQAQLTQRR